MLNSSSIAFSLAFNFTTLPVHLSFFVLSVVEPTIVNRILSIHLSQQSVNDQVFWCLNPSGEFFVKSAYNAIRTPSSISHPVMQSKDWKVLWKMKIHARLKNLLWKLAWEILPTASILNRRFTLPSIECHLCGKSLESLEHLFLQCD